MTDRKCPTDMSQGHLASIIAADIRLHHLYRPHLPNMANIWASQRLIYRPVVPTDDPFLAKVNSDPTDYTQSSNMVPHPTGPRDGTSYREFLTGKGQLLGCIICLGPGSAEKGTGDGSGDGQDESNPSSREREQKEPIPIGAVSLSGVVNPAVMHHRHSVLGIAIGKEHQSNGYGTDAIKWCFRWGFRFAGLHRIGVTAFEWNTGAIKLYRRMGLIEEGRQREYFFFDGRFWDAVCFSILEHEWRDKFEKAE
ncbi:acyl-CoA N-acyltransferase [Zalerion maritima]|uniref:Acyl-CoA N-acyltransferase n=1 Tax=Zalerion maritima TaxID=339359 RepID=A0AAD5WQC9_9PEZI|nr:acyl-CoA N-acyltransferase [Zalerion maritima]